MFRAHGLCSYTIVVLGVRAFPCSAGAGRATHTHTEREGERERERERLRW